MHNKAQIFVRFSFEGFHHWKDAPEHRAYLATRHRHNFHAEVRCSVENDDREIEFHDLLDCSKSFFDNPERGNQSCEMMARNLGKFLVERYKRTFTVSVSEDDECGAQVTTEL